METNKKKKIGCVIAYADNHNNYGTSLQGYAMLKKIQQLGYDCEIIRYIKKLSLIQKIEFIINAFRAGEIKNLKKRYLAKRTLNKYPLYAQNIKERTKAVNKYKEKKLIPLFHTYNGYKALHEGSENYSAVVVGSDQVWTPLSLPNKFFNLLFVKDAIPKIAYASSFGVQMIPKFQVKATGKYLNRFSYIGVREQRGKEIVESLSNQKAQVVADPTILLSSEEWKEEISNSKIQKKDSYIFCYFLGNNQEARKAVNKLKANTQYKIITIRHMDEYVPEDENFGDESPYNVDPNDFLSYIYNADYICTDSFHCTVFSILFHKKFMTFYRFSSKDKNSRNSRIDSLFNILNIDKSRIYTKNTNIEIDINQPIDYKSIDSKLSILRNESINFLKKALSITQY